MEFSVTTDTFIEKQKEHGLKYSLDNNSLRDEKGFYPICALALAINPNCLDKFNNENPTMKSFASNFFAFCVGADLGLSNLDIRSIIWESDGHIEGDIRKQLMELSGLNPPEIPKELEI